MPEQLKIIIDADVQGAVQGFEKVAASAGNLTTIGAQIEKGLDFNGGKLISQINELQSKLQSLKIKPVDVTVNTSGLDSTIKNIQAKFANLVDPKINVLANTAQAEASIKELIGELSALKGSEIFIRANDSQALKVINEIEAELNSLVGKQIRVNVDTGSAIERINVLEKELLALENLKIAPNISSTQLALFENNIQRIKAELNSLKGGGVVIPFSVNTATAQANLNTLSETIETLRAKIEARKSFITVETDISKIAAYNKEIEKLEARMRSIQNVGKKGFELFVVPNQTIQSVKNLQNTVASFGGGVKTFIAPAVNSFRQLPSAINPTISALKNLEATAKASGAATAGAFTKAFNGVKSLAAIIPGLGLGGLIGIAATAVNALTEGFFDAAFGASKLDKAIDAASDSVDKNAASVITMVRALQSGTLTSEQFKKVKAELIAQAPEFQKSFDGDKISIEASDKALTAYINKLTTTVRVTAALGIVNDTLAKSIRAIAKGEDFSFGDVLSSFFEGGLTGFGALEKLAEKSTKNVQKAIDSLKPENVSKLLEDTFKKLGITFNDFADTVGDGALEAALAKQKAAFDKFVNETIARAQQFKKQFGESFVLPELEVSFFTSKDQVFKNALKVLKDAKADLGKQSTINELEIKLPVVFKTETRLDDSDLKKFLRGDITRDQVKEIRVRVPIVTDLDIQLAQSLIKEFEPTKELIDNFFKSVQLERDIPIEVTTDLTLEKGNRDAIDKMIDLRKQFSVLGDLGFKEFSKIDFTNINAGLEKGTKILENMLEVANTINNAVGQGMVNAFNAVFDAVLEGKSVFKALGNAIKALIVDTIKAVAQMLILKAITNLLLPGSGGFGGSAAKGLSNAAKFIRRGNTANFGSGGIGSRSFQNSLTVNVIGQISNDTIRLSNQRSSNSSGRYG